MDTIPAADLERRKQVRLRLRPDLAVTRQEALGQPSYVIKDPVSLRYYRFDDRDHFLLGLLDGRRTMDDVRRDFEERFRPQRLTWEDLEAFGQLLLQAGLAYQDLPQAGQQLWERQNKRRRREWLQRLTSVLYIEFPLWDPDPLLDALHRRLRWLLSPWCFAAGVGVMLAALLLVALHFETFRSRLPAFEEYFRFRNLIYLWLALGVVKVLHEFGHGLACKRFGGEVHDMGLLLMCLSPCLYLNVSDAWTLPEKWKRMLVGFAGIYVELLVAAVAAFVWWFTPGEVLVHQLCLSLMVVCSLNTLLFNGNPLLRFDGYFILADWLEIPNLRERSNQVVQRFVLETCLGMRHLPEPPLAPWRRALFVTYAVASYLYSWVVTVGALWFLSQFLKPYKLGTVSALLAVLALASMVGWPLYRVGSRFFQGQRLPPLKARRVAVTAALATVLLLAFCFLPLPVSRIRETGLVQPRPDAVAHVYLPVTASLDRLHVREGQVVRSGELLAEFRSLELENQLEEARSQHAVRLLQMKTLRQQLAGTTDVRDRARLEVALSQADGERGNWAALLLLQSKKMESLQLRSPRAGVVAHAPRREEVGRLWDKEQGVPFCTIADPGRLRVVAALAPADFRLLQEECGLVGTPAATIRVHGWDRHTWQGRLAPLPESEARQVPAGLTTRAGGPLAIKPGAGELTPQSQVYLVAVDFLEGEPDGVWPGSLAQVKVHCRWRPAAWWVWRRISAALDLGLMG